MNIKYYIILYIIKIDFPSIQNIKYKKEINMSIPFKIKYKCDHCARVYTRKPYYDRHIACCKILQKTSRERKLENEENDDTPTLRELYVMIQEFGKKYEEINEKLDYLTKYVETKKKQLSIVDWLNTNIKCDIEFHKWMENIDFCDEYLNYVFQSNLIDGISYIFQDVIAKYEDSSLPIRAFDQKDSTFFIYIENEWIIMNKETFEGMIYFMKKNLLKLFKIWQDKNESKLKTDSFSSIYMQNVHKLMGGKIPFEKQYLLIKSKLYKHLKCDLKTIIQFEFV
jgi:hypothetical protein